MMLGHAAARRGGGVSAVRRLLSSSSPSVARRRCAGTTSSPLLQGPALPSSSWSSSRGGGDVSRLERRRGRSFTSGSADKDSPSAAATAADATKNSAASEVEAEAATTTNVTREEAKKIDVPPLGDLLATLPPLPKVIPPLPGRGTKAVEAAAAAEAATETTTTTETSSPATPLPQLPHLAGSSSTSSEARMAEGTTTASSDATTTLPGGTLPPIPSLPGRTAAAAAEATSATTLPEIPPLPSFAAAGAAETEEAATTTTTTKSSPTTPLPSLAASSSTASASRAEGTATGSSDDATTATLLGGTLPPLPKIPPLTGRTAAAAEAEAAATKSSPTPLISDLSKAEEKTGSLDDLATALFGTLPPLPGKTASAATAQAKTTATATTSPSVPFLPSNASPDSTSDSSAGERGATGGLGLDAILDDIEEASFGAITGAASASGADATGRFASQGETRTEFEELLSSVLPPVAETKKKKRKKRRRMKTPASAVAAKSVSGVGVLPLGGGGKEANDSKEALTSLVDLLEEEEDEEEEEEEEEEVSGSEEVEVSGSDDEEEEEIDEAFPSSSSSSYSYSFDGEGTIPIRRVVDGPPTSFGLNSGIVGAQAHGSALGSAGRTVVLSTVVYDPGDDRGREGTSYEADEEEAGEVLDVPILSRALLSASREYVGMVPLLVDYRERYHGAGRIPSEFRSRRDNAGRPRDAEILAGRAVDRALRPVLLPRSEYEEGGTLSVTVGVQSYDRGIRGNYGGERDDERSLSGDPTALAINSASAALLRSGLPFEGGPVGAVRVCLMRDGTAVVDPSPATLGKSKMDLLLAGTEEGITMLEFGSRPPLPPPPPAPPGTQGKGQGGKSVAVEDEAVKEDPGVPDETVADLIRLAHAALLPIIEAQRQQVVADGGEGVGGDDLPDDAELARSIGLELSSSPSCGSGGKDEDGTKAAAAAAVAQRIMDVAFEFAKARLGDVALRLFGGDADAEESIMQSPAVDVGAMTYKEMQAECKARGLRATGKSEELRQRLLEAMEEDDAVEGQRTRTTHAISSCSSSDDAARVHDPLSAGVSPLLSKRVRGRREQLVRDEVRRLIEFTIGGVSGAVENGDVDDVEGAVKTAVLYRRLQESAAATGASSPSEEGDNDGVAVGGAASSEAGAALRALADATHERLLRYAMAESALKSGGRGDGRGVGVGVGGLDTVRPVTAAVPALPNSVHGSALFGRGETSVLCTATLGAPGEGRPLTDPYREVRPEEGGLIGDGSSSSSASSSSASGQWDDPYADLPVGSLRYTRSQQAMESDLNTKKVLADQERTGQSGTLAEVQRAFLHYDFPAYSTGTVQSGRGAAGANRRAVGHGALAERAILPALPPPSVFPYAVRMTSEVTSSNGSSSMASACGATLALLDAGVPMTAPVAGVSVGLALRDGGGGVVEKKAEDRAFLLDLTGTEDHYGEMDFKIAGTESGVTAMQLDVKRPLPPDVVVEALRPASRGRRAVLRAMSDRAFESSAGAVAGLRPRVGGLKRSAPRVETVRFDPARKRDLVGPGGAVLRQLEGRYGISLDLSQEGQCLLHGPDAAMVSEAKAAVMDLVADVVEGGTYEGTVVEIKDYGAILELLRNKEGLLHVSELSDDLDDAKSHPGGNFGLVRDSLKVGDKLSVVCIGVDPVQGSIKLSRKRILQQQNKMR